MVETIIKSCVESNVFRGKLAEMRRLVLRVSEIKENVVQDGDQEEPGKSQLILGCKFNSLKTLRSV